MSDARCLATPDLSRKPPPRGEAPSHNSIQFPEHSNVRSYFTKLINRQTDLISECVEVHDEVLGCGVPVPHLALVAVGVPLHLVPLRLLLVTLMTLLRRLLDDKRLLHFPLGGQGHEVLVQPGHLRGRGLRVVPDPVVGVVDLDQGGDELGLCLADVTAPALLRPKHRVVIQRVVHNRVT